MTSSKKEIAEARRHIEIREFSFSDDGATDVKTDANSRLHNWPVVYIINNDERLYVGETTDFLSRTRQHLQNPQKQGLREIRVVLDDTFNKSTCLDLESQLIMLFSGDGKYQVINSNAGIADCDYFDREHYQVTFDQIVENLRVLGLFNQSALDIRNSNLFKYSPYKALNDDQIQVTEAIIDDLWQSLEEGESSVHVVQGSAGTGKTVVGIFLTKLLSDLGTPNQAPTGESVFDEYYQEGYKQLFEGRRIGLVVPQQSLRASVKHVFSKVSSLSREMVLTPFDVGDSDEHYDILIVDEAHRLNRFSAQSSGMMTKLYKEINARLFGNPESGHSQLDWLRKQCDHLILLIDPEQSVRPQDLTPTEINACLDSSRDSGRIHTLRSQLRIQGDSAEYGDFLDQLLALGPQSPIEIPTIEGYELRVFSDLDEMIEEIHKKDKEFGLSRLAAGYAWEWVSKTNRELFDINIPGARPLRWNSTDKDWVGKGSSDEVGSIHTLQGFDLNYAGVIIGPDIEVDEHGFLRANRERYADKRGKADVAMALNPSERKTTDEDLLRYIRNCYRVLLTRGIRGTYIYAGASTLRQRLQGS
jgi:hypothetical protein